MTILELPNKPPTTRVWQFQTVTGDEFEGSVPVGDSAEDLCCKMVAETGVPVRCVPKLIETSNGHRAGEIIV